MKIVVKCPKCGSTNIFGLYWDEYRGEPCQEWEPVNSTLSLDPQMYEKLSCEDCHHEWKGDIKYDN